VTDILTLEQVLLHLHESEALATLQPHWEESMACIPAVPDFLQPQLALSFRTLCGLSADTNAPLTAACEHIQADPALQQLAWHCHQLLWEHPDYTPITKWPKLNEALGNLSGVFYLLIALAMAPRVASLHQKMGVPADITRDTCSQVACFASNYHGMTNGLLGIPLQQMSWLRNYPTGQLFRIGRFEYRIKPFSGKVEVYRHKQTKRTMALALDGMRYTAAGLVAADDDNTAWTATLQHTANTVVGCPILPQGIATQQQMELPLNEWQMVLRQDDLMLDLHIPEGGSMNLANCADSLRRAAAFFRQFFPEQPVQAICSASWIFNTQLQDFKMSSDNLARFQRELYIFPRKSGSQDGLWFIFLQDPLDLATAPRRTSLQRAVADSILSGNTWRSAGMFLLIDDLDKFGSQVYWNS